MSARLTADEVPTDLRARRAWVIFQLRCKGTNLSELADDHDVRRQVMQQALTRPNARAEDIIAAAIGLTARELFPERFDSAGQRLFVIRPRRQPSESGAPPSRRKGGGR
ncbi:MAG TPA: helix-turn-helix domain-containing protein [Stellaceae bacterium]|jgi:lambda repressor-like predicted transcriptional regulator